MRYLKVDVKELHSSRLARLASELNIPATEALGLLVRFWAVTRGHRYEEATKEQLCGCLEVAGQQADDVLRALGSAGYLIDAGPGLPAIIRDNAGINTLSAKRAAAGKLGAAARAKPKAASKPKAPKVDEGAADRSLVWDAYATAYERRWEAPPVRNRKANALIKQLVDRLGFRAAQAVVQFYVHHNDGFYLQKTHDLQFCIRDCETLHTQMQRGQHVTRNDVRQAERENHHLAQLHRVANGEL